MTNRANLFLVTFITLARFPLVILFFTGALFFVQFQHAWLFFTSFAMLVLAAFTDLFDGYLARKLNVVTKFGAHADPLMDKFFYLSTLPLLVYVASTNHHDRHAIFLLVMTVLFLSRDQWVTFLRSIGSMYEVSGRANWSGKLRTAINFPMICVIYFVEEAPALRIIGDWVMYLLEAAAFISNFISLYIYTRNYWPYLLKSTDS